MQGKMKARMLPHVMVLVFEEGLTSSVWQDYQHRFRSLRGLIQSLRQGVREGVYVGYRFMASREDVIGNVAYETAVAAASNAMD